MTYLRRYLDGEPTVLVVGFDDPPQVARVVPEYELAFVADREAALAALDEGVVCVLARDSLPDGTGDDLATDVFEVTDDVSVLIAPTAGGADRAGAVGLTGARYVPPSASRGQFATALASGAESGERRRSESLLADAFEQLLSTRGETIYVKDADGRYLAVSNADERDRSLLGETDAQLAREGDADAPLLERRHRDALTVAESGEPILGAVERFGQGEGAAWLERTIYPWRVDGSIVGVVGIERSVTERHEARAALQTRIDRLERFTSYVSQELRSPLQVVDAYLDLAWAGDEVALDRLTEATDRMAELVDALERLVDGQQVDIERTQTARIAAIARDVWTVVGDRRGSLSVALSDDAVVNAPESTIRPLLEAFFETAVAANDRPDGGRESRSVEVSLGALDDGFYVEHAHADAAGDDPEPVSPGVRSTVEAQGWTLGLSRTDGLARYEVRNCMLVSQLPQVPELGGERTLDGSATVGSDQFEGRVAVDGDRWTLSSGRSSGEGQRSEFAYATVDGPVEITARLRRLDEGGPDGTAGLTIRSSLSTDAVSGSVGRTAGGGTEVRWQTAATTAETSQRLDAVVGRHDWFRLTFDGDRVTVSVSVDGRSWQPVDQRTLALPGRAHVGLIVSDTASQRRCTAAFDDVSVRVADDGR